MRVNNRRSRRARLSITMLAIFAVVGLFVGRLVDIQLVRADELNAESLDKRSVETPLYGIRGSILDTNGAVLADSVERYDITASPRVVIGKGDPDGSVAKDLQALGEVLGQDPAALMSLLTADPSSDWVLLAKGVTLETLNAVTTLDIDWLYSDLRPARVYPNGAIAGNLVGFVGTDGAQAGMELSADSCLASVDGDAVYEKGSDGVRIPGTTITTQEPVNGGTLKLTIDSDLEWYTQQQLAQQVQALGGTWGTALVVRVKDGHLMAVADYPTVDPNNVDGSDVADLGSRAFSTPYEPGSTMKSMTIASLIDAGVINAGTQIIAPGRIDLGDGDYIKDAWAHDDIRYTAAGALMNSSNTGISKLTEMLDAQTRYEYMLKFGLDEKTEVDFNGESSGLVHPPQEWDKITTLNVQFGQGLTATSAQMASIYQTIGNGGVRMPLTLVEGCEMPDGTVTMQSDAEGTRVVSEQAATSTINILEEVVRGGLKIDVPGYRVAAKTGTAEVSNGLRYTDERVISIAGLAPADDPQYAIVVTVGVPSSMYISSAVAPAFKSILTQTLKTFRVEPSTEPAPEIPLEW